MEIVMQALSLGVIMTTARDYTGSTKYMVQYGLQFTVFDSFREALQDYENCCMHSQECGD